MPQVVIDLMVDRVDLVDEGANSAAFIKMYKRKENESVMEFTEILEKMKPEHAEVIRAEIAKAKSEVPAETQQELDSTKQDLEKANADKGMAFDELDNMKQDVAKRKQAEEPNFEEVMKGLDPAVQAVFKSIKDQKEVAERTVREQHDRTVHEQAVAKAKELKALPVEEAKLVDVLKSASPEVVEILKAASAFVEESPAFKEIGKSKSTSTESGDAWSKIEKRADELVKSENITKAAAITRVTKENPDLYREYLKSNDGGVE